ncbi:hypothetical protein [Paenibacillus sp. S150]|uniref:hypothetical protein n=1 Tax=Paenibacillus sp. S150 TaxID=2749826 RepID=UPI001C57E278|nr:hypothetical protein [Paenibacillus sp. S150]MBW4081856.1 hypothetical protein [Paenibacillus sp. S150]
MIFSTIEGVGMFAMMLSFFRLKATDYIWPALSAILLMNLQSYVLRDDFSLPILVPIINAFLFIILLAAVVKIPVVWAGIVTVSGYLAFAFIQTMLVLIVFGSLSNAQSSAFNMFSGQAMSGLISTAVAWLLYKFGIGFMFDFERLRLRWEGAFVVTLSLAAIMLFSFIVYKNDIRLYAIFLPASLVILLYYAVRKERMND